MGNDSEIHDWFSLARFSPLTSTFWLIVGKNICYRSHTQKKGFILTVMSSLKNSSSLLLCLSGKDLQLTLNTLLNLKAYIFRLSLRGNLWPWRWPILDRYESVVDCLAIYVERFWVKFESRSRLLLSVSFQFRKMVTLVLFVAWSAVAATLFIYLSWLRKIRRLEKIPGPEPWPCIGNALDCIGGGSGELFNFKI